MSDQVLAVRSLRLDTYQETISCFWTGVIVIHSLTIS
jgi:hypothetical protein